MNRGEAAEVLDELTAAYPRNDLNERQIDAWLQALVDSGAEFHSAGRQARMWARYNEWFPSLAQFLAAITPHRAWTPDDDRPEIHPEVARRMGGMWGKAFEAVDKRAAEATRGANGHWHGGPDPCPVCGGIRPDLNQRTP